MPSYRTFKTKQTPYNQTSAVQRRALSVVQLSLIQRIPESPWDLSLAEFKVMATFAMPSNGRNWRRKAVEMSRRALAQAWEVIRESVCVLQNFEAL